MFTGWKWRFILYLSLLAAFIQAGKLDWMGACREYLNIQSTSSTGVVQNAKSSAATLNWMGTY